jgi:putative membrane protein
MQHAITSSSCQVMRQSFLQKISLVLFLLYLAVFPGSTLTVALDRVPAWGEWMGGALLLLQGAIVLGWLIGRYGRRGALAGLLTFLLAWGVEYIGVTTGLPFGRYRYTAALQPQLLGVPLAIVCAWLMVALGAWQLATTGFLLRPGELGWLGEASTISGRRSPSRPCNQLGRRLRSREACPELVPERVEGVERVVGVATLVLLLDAQIETVAASINRYWIWLDSGPYYAVPTTNFVAWWLVGLVLAMVVSGVLGGGEKREPTIDSSETHHAEPFTVYGLRLITAYLYLLNTLMFTVINFVRGYVAAGLVGFAVLLAAALAIVSAVKTWAARAGARAARQTPD